MNQSNIDPSPERSFPPLPDTLPAAENAFVDNEPSLAGPLQPHPIPIPLPRFRAVRCGCYLVNYTPNNAFLVTYDGPLRVECHSAGRTASGDLYQRGRIFIPRLGGTRIPILLPGPNPASGIPVFSRTGYRYYLRVTQILEGITLGNKFTLGFEMHRFNLATRTWTNEGALTAQMAWMAAPAGYPSANDYLAGDVKNSGGAVVGRLTMGWISSYLRKATIEIDRVAPAEAPSNNGSGIDWKAIGDAIGWDLTLDQSDINVAELSGESWSNAECHQAMLARRDAANLNAEWRYHILCVRRLDATERGIMYDNGATDSNNVPREGCAISSHWMIPNTASWGLVRNMRFGIATKPYYRTAVHETGHALGLYHNTADNGFMNTTDVIAASATAANPFPNNIQWSFAADDQKRLRHMPDVYVRPGGTPFGTSYGSTPLSPTDNDIEVDGLRLNVTPLLTAVPLGAPVRVNLSLTNVTNEPLEAPSTLSLGSGIIRGQVIDPSGIVRTFSPLVLCVDEVPLKLLKPGEIVTGSLTLLRGGQGALFPAAGPYRIRVEGRWSIGHADAVVAGETGMMVTAAVDKDHAAAALKVLATPDTLPTLVFGGDHLDQGIEAIQFALDNLVLRPHFAHIEAKRVAQGFGKRKPNLQKAAELIDETTVMSPAELKKAASFAQENGDDSASRNYAAKLKGKIAEQSIPVECA